MTCASPKDLARLEALEDAYYSGTLQVTHGDKTVRYRSLDDIWQAILRLKERMGCGDASGGRSRTIHATYTKGL